MKHSESQTYQTALNDIRAKLTLRRGYASRIANKLQVKHNEIYAVAWGRKKDPIILQALVDEAKESVKQLDPSYMIVNQYLKNVA